MLVINANNQQDTTNFMLADPQYPDLNQILMRGWPRRVYTMWNATATTAVSFATIDTVAWTNIHFYCPKINKYQLWLVQSPATSEWADRSDVMPDIWVIRVAGWSWQATCTISSNIIYNIAVSWLPGWKIIGENIYVPYLFHTSTNWDIVWTWMSVKFSLLHKDWTSTEITTVNLSRQGGTATTNMCNNVWWAITTACWIWSYNWTWQTSVEWDVLCATVTINVSQIKVNYWWWMSWIINSWTYPYPRDIKGFRPFQVSIRDS